ncbi:MAG: hypothetical protein JNL74_21030 [Fibrobacteres bacterium]|nr:hypothetical protein [Fibrobacterota bacterium]
MINDAIVDEVRAAANKIMAKTDYDPMKYVRQLQRNQKKSKNKLVNFCTKQTSKNIARFAVS